MSSYFRSILLVGLLFLTSLAHATAPLYVVTDLGSVSGKTQSSGNSINTSGAVACLSSDDINSFAPAIGFVWNPAIPNGTSGLGSVIELPPVNAFVINDSGIVAGDMVLGLPPTQFSIRHAFISDLTGLHDLGTLGGQFSAVYGINSSEQVVGYSETSLLDISGAPILHAFLRNPGQPMTDLGHIGVEPSGYVGSTAQALNNSGQVTGDSSTSTFIHAFLWKPTSPNASEGAFTDLGSLPGHRSSHGFSINDYGQIVGDSNTSRRVNGIDVFTRHGFLWTPDSANTTVGAMTDIGTLPESPITEAYSINSSGQVVGVAAAGYSLDAGVGYIRPHAMGWNPATPHGTIGALSDLNLLISPTSGWVLQYAFGINKSGQITGEGTLHGQIRGFLLTPVQNVAFTPQLARTDFLTATMTVKNRGLGPVTLQVVGAKLGGAASVTGLTTLYSLPVSGSQLIRLDFPLSAGSRGDRTLLKVTWRTATGRFSNIYRMTLP